MSEQKIEQIVINGVVYDHAKTRVYTPVSIFRGNGEYLRIGPRDLITPELELHKKLLGYGFPVPVIIAEGEHDGKMYYTEESFGEDLLGLVFRKDCSTGSCISDEHFASLLEVSEKFASAQLKTISEGRDYESFYIGVHMDFIQEELPESKGKILAAFEKLEGRTSGLPPVLTHGDFNAYNIFERGVIDFGSTHSAPAGYDIVNNIYHTYNFPKSGLYESMQRYTFTQEQVDSYFELMDDMYVNAGLPKISNFKEDFIFAKAIWSTTRMQKYPRLQKWRYDRFKRMLSEYLNGGSIMHTVLEFEQHSDGV